MGRGVQAGAELSTEDCAQEATPGPRRRSGAGGLLAGRGGVSPAPGPAPRRPLTPTSSAPPPPACVSLQKAGGGLRQWKRVYAALRARCLLLSKERREPGPAAAAGAAAVAGEDEAAPVCIGSCLVDISYSETKRRHVFRLTTADFCEYLFQAEDRDDMLGWIRAIRENSRAEGEVRAGPREAGAGPRAPSRPPWAPLPQPPAPPSLSSLRR